MVWGGLLDVAAMLPFCGKGFFCVMSLSLFAFDHDAFLVLPGMGKGLRPGFGMVTPFVVIGLNCIYGEW